MNPREPNHVHIDVHPKPNELAYHYLPITYSFKSVRLIT